MEKLGVRENLASIKRDTEFIEYIKNIWEYKISSFSKVTNCKKTIQLVMVTTFGVKRNKYSGLVGTQVLLDDLFCEWL